MPSVDVTAPSLPSLFAATSLTSSKINVGWEPSGDASGVAGYSLYKNGSLYRILTPATVSLLEDGLDSTLSYAYKVQAFDYSGNTSAFTTTATTGLALSPLVFKSDFEADAADSTADIAGWAQQRPKCSKL